MKGNRKSAGRANAEGTLDERTLARLEAAHAEGMSSAQIVEAFLARGVKLSEATFRKWVQLGLLPRSRRVGRKGKHQGSRGLYPSSTLRRIATVKRLMADNLTIEDIGAALRYQEQLDGVRRGLDDLLDGFQAELSARSGERAEETRESRRLVTEARRAAGELVRRLEAIERRLVAPLLRAAKARAFASGAGGGADELL